MIVQLKKLWVRLFGKKIRVEFTDRYQALGITPGLKGEVCPGACEGTGVFPVYMSKGDNHCNNGNSLTIKDEDDPKLIALWEEAEKRRKCFDGWHFIICPDCQGTGIKNGGLQ